MVLLVLIHTDLHRLFSSSPFLSSDAHSVFVPRKHSFCAKPFFFFFFLLKCIPPSSKGTNKIYILVVKSAKTIPVKKEGRSYPSSDLIRHDSIDLTVH